MIHHYNKYYRAEYTMQQTMQGADLAYSLAYTTFKKFLQLSLSFRLTIFNAITSKMQCCTMYQYGLLTDGLK